MKHDESQVYLLNKVADYIKRAERKGIDSSSSSLCYFPTWTNDPGLIKLKLWLYGYSKIFSYIKKCDFYVLVGEKGRFSSENLEKCLPKNVEDDTKFAGIAFLR